MHTLNYLLPVFPELFLLAMIALILVADLFIPTEEKRYTYILAFIALAGTFMLTLINQQTIGSVLALNNMYVADSLAYWMKIFLLFGVLLFLAYSRQYLIDRNLYSGEFLGLVLFATLGMMILISSRHLIPLYLGLELMALSQYALVALQRDSKLATEAAMKYFVLGALSSGLLLYGMSMLYGATGSLFLPEISSKILHHQANHYLIGLGVVFVIAGLAFKLGAVPFHMWVPDVYQGASTATTAFIGSVTKFASLAFVLRLLVQGLQEAVLTWQPMLIILSVLSLVVGNLAAVMQTNLKRMLAYSSISHMGFLLMGILVGNVNGYTASFFYTFTYVMTTLATFGVMLVVARAGFEAEWIEDYRGLGKRSPWYAFLMLLCMLSLAGVPPLIGFFPKLEMLRILLSAGFLWLAIVAVITSVIGAFYYLRIIKVMYFEAATDTTPVTVESDARLFLTLNGLALLLFGLMPNELMALCRIAIHGSL